MACSLYPNTLFQRSTHLTNPSQMSSQSLGLAQAGNQPQECAQVPRQEHRIPSIPCQMDLRQTSLEPLRLLTFQLWKPSISEVRRTTTFQLHPTCQYLVAVRAFAL